ncbi:7106_t:CDS:2 [Entrophospora sp. SA101]|nr:7106_t:CDS:2 [Entrophospora sp. SA101]
MSTTTDIMDDNSNDNYSSSSGEEENKEDNSITKKEELLLRNDRTLTDILLITDKLEPLIPDSVTEYFLTRSGFSCDDDRIMRLMSIATQKFIADIATDAFQYCKIRQQSRKNFGKQRNKTVLTLEDLSAALSEYGINVKKPDYYRA